MSGVTWLSLSLAGFGGYREKVTVDLQDGFNVLVAPNEAGKSTVLAGLEAVLFGLPSSSDQTSFGSGRFRNRENPAEFSGEVEFLDGTGQRWRLRRRFEDHLVNLYCHQKGHWEEEWRGVHNPGAHKKNDVYNQKVLGLIGVYSRSLFEATFCVRQPLPEMTQLNDEVQKLLSGSGGHYQEALKSLFEDLRRITRLTRERVGGKDATNPAQLEKLQAEIDRLRKEIDQAKGVIDSLAAFQEEIQKTAGEEKEVRGKLKEKSDLLAAWKDWDNLRSRYNEALRKQRDANNQRDRVRKLEETINEKEEEAARLYPEWDLAGSGDQEELEGLVQRSKELEKKLAELLQAQQRLAVLEQVKQELVTRRQEKLATVADKPDLWRDLLDLQERWRQKSVLEKALADLEREESEARERLQSLPDFGRLDRNPRTAIAGLRVAGQRLLADWREFQVKLARWQAMEQELQGNLAVFGDLTPEGLSFCADYEASKLRLEGELEKAIAAEKQLVERQENYLQTKGAFERDFGDLLDLVPEARQAVREKQRLEQQLREGERERTLLEKRGLQTRSLTALLLALSGLLAGILAHNLLLALGGGALLGLLGWGIGGIISQHQHAPIRSHLAARLDDWRKELQQANALLGLWSREPLEKLDELSYRLWEREHRRQELDQVEASRPTETEESEVREARKAAGQRLDSFRAATATVRARFADVAEAYRRYQDLLVTAEELRQEVIRFARQETGTSPEGAATAPVDGLTSPWRELRVLAEIRGAEGAATGQILDWLQKMDDFVWQGLEQEAARWEDSVSTLQRLEDRRRSLLQGGDTGETVLLRLERGINHLRGKVAPFNEETPLESLRPLLEEAGEVQRRLTELDGTLNLASNQVKDLRDAKETIEQEVQSRSGRLSRILGAGGGDLARAHERLRDWRFRQEETGKLKSQLSGALGGRALADLENEAIDAGNQALAIWQEWQALVRDHPGLPSPGNQDNSEAIERHFRDLKEEVAGLKGQADTLSVRLQELILRRAQLEGSQPLNVAVGEDLLARKEAEVRRIKLEAEALGLAYRELEAAAQEFSSTYRQTLMEATTRYFQDFTGRPNRRVTLEEDFSLGIVEDASAVSLAQISRGTLDQLYLAARLAIGDMVGGEVALPFLFDDPFHNCDSDRLERIRFSLGRLAQERQILLLSHDDKFLNWGQAVKLKQSPGKG